MLLRLPTSLPEAQECLTDGAIPVGGATLVWAAWQRDGFPEQAVSLREVPEANVLGRSEERRVGKECRSRWSPYH